MCVNKLLARRGVERNSPPPIEILQVAPPPGFLKCIPQVRLNLRDLLQVVGYLEALHIYMHVLYEGQVWSTKSANNAP